MVDEDPSSEALDVLNVSGTIGGSRDPALAVNGGEVMLVWQEARSGSGAAADGGDGESGSEEWGRFDVVFSRSLDGGATWEAPITVAQSAGASPEPQVAVAGSTIGVAWLEDRPPDVDVRFARVVCP